MFSSWKQERFTQSEKKSFWLKFNRLRILRTEFMIGVEPIAKENQENCIWIWLWKLSITIRPKPEKNILKQKIRRRSEEHTSELQSRPHLVCRLLLEKKKEKED